MIKMHTISISDDNYKKLLRLAGELQIKRNSCVSLNDVITRVLISEKVILEADY
jgi:predicted CopG family antitoxin